MATPLRLRALKSARKYIGVTEHPPYSNRGNHIDQWNMDACGEKGVYWCCSFIHGIFKENGFTLPGGASVSQVLAWARSKRLVVARPRKGDLVCFDFNEGDRYGKYGDHIGIVEKVLALRWSNGTFTGWIQTIEGNTSAQADVSGSQSNGGGVFRRRRWIRGIGAAFVRVPG